MPNYRIAAAIEGMVKAIEDGARERAAYLADPHEREADRVDFLKMVDKRRDDTVKAAKVALSTEFDRIATTYQRARKTSFDEAAVNAAWDRQVKPLLDNLRDVEWIAAQPGFDRSQAEALRRYLPAYEAVRYPEARVQDIERRIRPDLYTVLRAEIKHMDAVEAQATEQEFERVAAADVVSSVDKMAVTAATTGKVAPVETLATGYAMAAAGLAQPPETWEAIVARISPLDLAQARFDRLDPDTRARVEAAAKTQGFEQPTEVEPSLRIQR